MNSHNLVSLPIYRKALDLCVTSREIASYFSYNKDLLQLYRSNKFTDILADAILTDAILLPCEIERAERSKTDDARMYSISFINVITHNITAYCKGLEMSGVKEVEYLNILRAELSSFRKVYKTWRRGMK